MPIIPMTKEIDQIQLLSIVSSLPTDKRHLVAIAGPPGAGKTTLTNWLVEELNKAQQHKAQALYMDGFHFDNILLTKMNLLPRKGSPNTFDVKGLENTLGRIRMVPTEDVVVPVFDRDLEIARAGGSIISRDVNLLVVEGNYILCGQQPWNQLLKYFDLTILLKVPRTILELRLRERWEFYQLDENSIQFKLFENDLPNGDFVMANSRNVDYHLIQANRDTI